MAIKQHFSLYPYNTLKFSLCPYIAQSNSKIGVVSVFMWTCISNVCMCVGGGVGVACVYEREYIK